MEIFGTPVYNITTNVTSAVPSISLEFRTVFNSACPISCADWCSVNTPERQQ